MNEHKRLAIDALEILRGDDLERAQFAFRGLSPEQMQQQYGATGRTRQQILDEYVAQRAKYDAAIAWLRTV